MSEFFCKGLDEKISERKIISYPSVLPIGPIETVLLSTNNIYFGLEIRFFLSQVLTKGRLLGKYGNIILHSKVISRALVRLYVQPVTLANAGDLQRGGRRTFRCVIAYAQINLICLHV